ncbi:MAG TPA: hypothetical protein VM659_23270, partial [Dongiaceae bacterium]|nr:hypothetical protein [Dongiaceae bacterium]
MSAAKIHKSWLWLEQLWGLVHDTDRPANASASDPGHVADLLMPGHDLSSTPVSSAAGSAGSAGSASGLQLGSDDGSAIAADSKNLPPDEINASGATLANFLAAGINGSYGLFPAGPG